MTTHRWQILLDGLVTAVFPLFLLAIFFWVPTAQEAAGGIVQRIFYFHVPAAYGMYLGGTATLIGSIWFLLRGTDEGSALAWAGSELAVLCGAIVLTSGPLWARKAWGTYWTWDIRLTTSLFVFLVYLSVVLLRRYAGDGYAERKFAAALGVLGSALIPVVHFSVRLWGGNHPTVISRTGGGLGDPRMGYTLAIGFFWFTCLGVALLLRRTRLHLLEERVAQLEAERLY